MVPELLILKGFTGIKKGMGLDEIRLDLTKCPQGIIIFSGQNGKGKTTILDNLHPFRIMPSRVKDGNYSPSAFDYYGEVEGEAQKELIFWMDGVRYMEKINIDPGRKKQEAFLFIDTGREGDKKWAKYPGIDGKLGSYDKAIVEVCGSPELFFAAPFRCQRAKPMGEYKKGPIEQLISELIGSEGNKVLSEKARRVEQALAGKVETLQYDRKTLKEKVDRETEYTEAHKKALEAVDKSKADVEALEAELVTVQQQINECDVQIGLQRDITERRKAVQKDLDEKKLLLSAKKDQQGLKVADLEKKKGTVEEKLSQHEIAVSKKGETFKGKKTAFEQKRDRYAELIKNGKKLLEQSTKKDGVEAKIEEVKKEITDLEEKGRTLDNQLTAFNKVELSIKEKEKALQSLKTSKANNITHAERDLEQAQKKSELLQRIPCTADMAATCELSQDAAEANKCIPKLEKDLQNLKDLDGGEIALTAEIEALKESVKDKDAKNKERTTIYDNNILKKNDLKGYESELKTINSALDLLPQVKLAEEQKPLVETELEALQTEIDAWKAENSTQFDNLNYEISTLETEIQNQKNADEQDLQDINEAIADLTTKLDGIKIDTTLETTKETYKLALEHTKERITQEREAGAKARESIGAMLANLEEVETAKGKLETVNTRIEYLNGERSQWKLLERAFLEIISMEIDDAGPSISGLTNELLKVYGGRFSIRFQTQGLKSDGKSTKEEFSIMVLDSRDNTVDNLLKKSGGEREFIEDAITKSIAIYNGQSSGKAYKTLFSDERDGALDPEKKKHFFTIKKKVLEIGGYEREFCVTHTEALKGMADAIIELGEDGVEIIQQGGF
jgi:DNA repair protein SbcC/Rad50